MLVQEEQVEVEMVSHKFLVEVQVPLMELLILVVEEVAQIHLKVDLIMAQVEKV